MKSHRTNILSFDPSSAIPNRRVEVESAGVEKIFAFGNIFTGVKVLIPGDVNEKLQFISQNNNFRPEICPALPSLINFYLFSLENVTLFFLRRLYV